MAKGDHIRTRRLGGVYSHHGIDMGDGTVIHFSGEPIRPWDACICRVPLEDFIKEGELIVVKHPAEDCRAPEEVVEMALSFLGKTGYDLWLNNCEHFAWYCKTGHKKSKQVKQALKIAAGTAATVAVVAGTTAVSLMARRLRGRG